MKLLSISLNNFRFDVINHTRFISSFQIKPPWNVLFFGADDFSLYSLKALYKECLQGVLLDKLEVATLSDDSHNPVWKYAKKEKLVVHRWPVSIEKGSFHLGVVVSFGKLIPESIICKFPFGILNVHASLLPRWRGAAPIIYALAKGDTETGVTIMQIKPRHFDIGEILVQNRFTIPKNMCMPQLHQKLGHLGAECLVDTLKHLPESLKNAKPQSNEGVTLAPKVTPEFAIINWTTMSSNDVYNLYRALQGFLSPTTSWNAAPVKLQDIEDSRETINDSNKEQMRPGYVKYDKKSKTLRITCMNRTSVSVGKVGVFGKRIMSASDFNNGYLKKVVFSERYFK